MKKLIAMLMAGAMILALSVPAFAEGEGQENQGQENQGQENQGQENQGQENQGQENQGQENQGQENQGQENQGQENQNATAYKAALTAGSDGAYSGSTDTDAVVKAPVVKISLPVVPDSGGFVLNPYRMPYSTAFTAGVSVTMGTNEAKNPIVSPTYVIKSESEVPLKVGLTVDTTIAGSHMKSLAGSAVKAGDTGNNLFLRVIMATPAAGTTQTSNAAISSPTTTLTLKSGKVSLAAKDQPTIAKGTLVANTADEYTPNYLAFAFDGSMSDTPINPWVEADKVTVKMAWSFMPTVTST